MNDLVQTLNRTMTLVTSASSIGHTPRQLTLFHALCPGGSCIKSVLRADTRIRPPGGQILIFWEILCWEETNSKIGIFLEDAFTKIEWQETHSTKSSVSGRHEQEETCSPIEKEYVLPEDRFFGRASALWRRESSVFQQATPCPHMLKFSSLTLTGPQMPWCSGWRTRPSLTWYRGRGPRAGKASGL